jgi:hypothetical protein
MSRHRREEARLEREANGFVEREKYEELGWVVLDELPEPPAAGGSTYIMGWMTDDPPKYPRLKPGDTGVGGLV